jgi:hypothetical protein
LALCTVYASIAEDLTLNTHQDSISAHDIGWGVIEPEELELELPSPGGTRITIKGMEILSV